MCTPLLLGVRMNGAVHFYTGTMAPEVDTKRPDYQGARI
jgi:hypothetical protein